MCHIAFLIAIIIAGGALGGIASYAAGDIPAEEKHPLIRRVILGVAAAAVVPLFLNMISSSILEEAEQNPTKYFVLAGFCVAAAFGSKTFLASISKQMSQRLSSVEDQQSEMASEIEPIISKETEPLPSADDSKIVVNSVEQQILRALANKSYSRRYLPGVAKEAKLSIDDVADNLHSLQDKGLVNSKRGKQGNLFWLTSLGNRIASKPELAD